MKADLLPKIGFYVTIGLAFLLPLFFLPTTTDFFDLPKNLLLITATSLLLVAWAVKHIINRTVRITLTPLTLPLAILTAVNLASTLLQSPNKVDAFLGRTGTLTALFILFFVVTNHISSVKHVTRLFYALIASATVLSVLSIYQFLGLNSLFTDIAWLIAPTFTPAGSTLGLITFLIPLLALTLYQAFIGVTDTVEKITLFIISGLMVVALIISATFLLPGKPTAPVLLPYPTGWAIAVDTFKSLRQGLLGAGPDNFLAAFALHRPAALNLTPQWNLRFTASSNEPLHLVATTGLLGLLAWAFLIFTFVRHLPADKRLILTTALAFALQLVLPANYLLLSLTYFSLILCAVSLPHRHIHLHSTIPPTSVLAWIIGVPIFLLVGSLWYVSLNHVYAAEAAFKQSLDALQANQGTDTYNFQIQAIQKNPYIARYHRAYATTNLALANTLSQTDQELSTGDRQNITQLIQQSIREAKLATQLNPQDPANWETLAIVYRNLINVAQGADQWAIAAYAQAAQSDPLSPRLRLDLGGVYYAIGRYDEAIRAFQQATELKPDWANAYYNLSSAYKAKGELKNALLNLQTVIKLVDPGSADYLKAQSEIQELAGKVGDTPVTPSPAQTDLQNPAPAPSPQPGFTNITLPDSASPGDLTTP